MWTLIYKHLVIFRLVCMDAWLVRSSDLQCPIFLLSKTKCLRERLDCWPKGQEVSGGSIRKGFTHDTLLQKERERTKRMELIRVIDFLIFLGCSF